MHLHCQTDRLLTLDRGKCLTIDRSEVEEAQSEYVISLLPSVSYALFQIVMSM